MTNSFYMVLTSDASLSQYPENKAADFKMQLSSKLLLSEDWEMAMTRIIYPYTWQNVGENHLSYTSLCKTNSEPWKLNIPVPSGIYRNGQICQLRYDEGTTQSIERHLFGVWKERSLFTFKRKHKITLSSS